MPDGPWETVLSQRSLANGPFSTVPCQRSLVNGRLVICRRVNGRLINGLFSTVACQRSFLNGPLETVACQRSLVNGRLSTVALSTVALSTVALSTVPLSTVLSQRSLFDGLFSTVPWKRSLGNGRLVDGPLVDGPFPTVLSQRSLVNGHFSTVPLERSLVTVGSRKGPIFAAAAVEFSRGRRTGRGAWSAAARLVGCWISTQCRFFENGKVEYTSASPRLGGKSLGKAFSNTLSPRRRSPKGPSKRRPCGGPLSTARTPKGAFSTRRLQRSQWPRPFGEVALKRRIVFRRTRPRFPTVSNQEANRRAFSSGSLPCFKNGSGHPSQRPFSSASKRPVDSKG
ncbi:hypothetical protein M885DRAFT_326691 [Pelagophyceae sp. CCMP2097]|nr:hypothetical protein M885DRAFT_326691 [Pelagophyceae sp. CCMP2097]